MKARLLLRVLLVPLLGLLLAGCATTPYDYTNYRAHPPRSILVLPPLNESTAVDASYSYLSTVSFPLAEAGYYVFPVAEVDHFLKENGMPTPGEMHQIPLDKARDILGADAVLYLTIKQYGTKYVVVSSVTTVTVSGKLVDTRTGLTLWEGTGTAQDNSGGSGNIIADLISAALTQVINSSVDHAHAVCRLTNVQLFTLKDHGLLDGPYHPKESDK
ncbi:MAG TPA: GNA1162 family protein [Dongiaceae bacterium]|nr:GNA1162 family protein [Dongiaceae bacterium]